jgi:hypothetical protein
VTPDDKLSALIDRVLVHMRAPLETNLRAFAQEFLQQVDAAQASAVAEAVAATRREAQSRIDQLKDEVARARRTADAEVADIRRLSAAEIEGARQQASLLFDEAERQSSALLAAARRERDEARAGLERAERDVADARRAAETAERERAVALRSLDEMRHAATLASETLSGVAARTQQIVDAIRAVDSASSIGDVLECVAHAAKSYSQRSALLMVRGARLTTWRTGDFPGAQDRHLDECGLIAAAVQQRRPQVRFEGTPDGDAPLPSFAADAGARDAVAVPIVLGGEAVAVLYADAPRGGDTADRRWPLALEVVTRYASRVIEAITLQRSAGLPVPTRVTRASRDPETLA